MCFFHICFIMFTKSSSDIFFFASINCSTSLPARYLNFGLPLVTALNTTSATYCGVDPLSNNLVRLSFMPVISGAYGELGSFDFFAKTEELKKFVFIIPGSIKITFMPNGSTSYDIDSVRPSTANLVLTYAEPVGKPNLPAPELILTINPDLCFLIIGRTACVVLINPNTLVSYCVFISSKERSSNAPVNP